MSKMYDDQIGLVESEVLGLAKAMPAAKYNFAPTVGDRAQISAVYLFPVVSVAILCTR